MSYILDALRKSESERHRGKVPDLGQSVQMIHRPRKHRRLPPVVWIVLALLVNAVVLAVVFWPRLQFATPAADASPVVGPQRASSEGAAPLSAASGSNTNDDDTRAASADDAASQAAPVVSPTGQAPEPAALDAPPEQVSPAVAAPTIIVPAPRRASAPSGMTAAINFDTVPHLIELPLSFQRRVPDLTFNSHIYSSDPQARRVMINGQYLRPGDRFDGLTVEGITEDAVVLSLDGQRFRIGAMRDWMSPR